MNDYDKLHAQAEILEKLLAWCTQPDVPTGRLGWVSSTDLRMRAIGLRAEADVMHEPPKPFDWFGPLALALQHAWSAGRRTGHEDALAAIVWMGDDPDWDGQEPSMGFLATLNQELTERPDHARRQLEQGRD